MRAEASRPFPGLRGHACILSWNDGAVLFRYYRTLQFNVRIAFATHLLSDETRNWHDQNALTQIALVIQMPSVVEWRRADAIAISGVTYFGLQLGLSITINTNGVIVLQWILKELARHARLSVQVSLTATGDAHAPRPDSYRKVVRTRNS